jgi:ABC-2 type transport system permease protein
MSTPLPRRRVNEFLLFQRLRWRLLRNSWEVLASQSSMRPLTILLCSVVVCVFVFSISLGGFRFLRFDMRLPLSGGLVEILLDLLFLALAALLVFSSGLILYGSLFTAAETNFLLSKPVRSDQVFAYKFQGAVAFSSWAFLLLGGPVLIAYGLVCGGPWYYYAYLLLFFLGFVLLPGSLGGLIALLVVNYVPRQRKQLLLGLVAIVLTLAGLWIYQLVQTARSGNWGSEPREAVTSLLGRFAFAGSKLMPSHWVARGLGRAGRGDVPGASYYLALVWSNGLLMYLLAAAAAARLYRRGYNRIATGGTIRRRYGGTWIDRAVEHVLPFIDPRTRLLIVKDFRTFRRDPQQWTQILIFSGLMLLYFMNIRRLFIGDIQPNYQNMISLLNLCAIALLLCTYTGRFVYPLLSLEGRKFWVLGLLPVKREQLLWGKFAFSTTGGLVIAEALMLVSDLMLEMPWEAVVVHVLTVAVLAAGLSGLSVGLGACMPNFRENDPSKIAVGFGGTLNLVAGLLFLMVTLALMAGPWHLQAALAGTLLGGGSTVRWALMVLGLVAGLAVGATAVVAPLHAGVRALRQMEF